MLETISERLVSAFNRRGFLRTAASATGAIALTLLGVKPAYATFDINGCHLCGDPSKCSYGSCACEWSWIGRVNNGDGTCDRYLCKECYTSAVCPANATSDGCTGWKCSASTFVDTVTCGGGGGACNRKPC